MHDCPAVVDRGLCIVLTVVSGAALFAAEACHDDLARRVHGSTSTTTASMAPAATRPVEPRPSVDAADAAAPEHRVKPAGARTEPRTVEEGSSLLDRGVVRPRKLSGLK
jgi:hypothetical protein